MFTINKPLDSTTKTQAPAALTEQLRPTTSSEATTKVVQGIGLTLLSFFVPFMLALSLTQSINLPAHFNISGHKAAACLGLSVTMFAIPAALYMATQKSIFALVGIIVALGCILGLLVAIVN